MQTIIKILMNTVFVAVLASCQTSGALNSAIETDTTNNESSNLEVESRALKNRNKKHGRSKYIVPGWQRYKGEQINGLANGKGAMYFLNGDRYEGDFKNGKMVGSGKIFFGDGGKKYDNWKEGEVLAALNASRNNTNTERNTANNKLEYRDNVILDDGKRYSGYVLTGTRTPHGKGKKYWSNGHRYEGNFVNGETIGNGVIYFKNGDKKSGTWSAGQVASTIKNSLEFRQSVILDNGKRYSGYVLNGTKTPHGKGKMFYTNGHYEGEFVNGTRSGKGKDSWSSGHRYEGDFVDNKRSGKGKYYWPNGNQYEGEFANNELSGIGTYFYSNGDYQYGRWKNSKLVEVYEEYIQSSQLAKEERQLLERAQKVDANDYSQGVFVNE